MGTRSRLAAPVGYARGMAASSIPATFATHLAQTHEACGKRVTISSAEFRGGHVAGVSTGPLGLLFVDFISFISAPARLTLWRTDWTTRLPTGSSDPLTSLRFGDRSQKRERQKILVRGDQLIGFTLAG